MACSIHLPKGRDEMIGAFIYAAGPALPGDELTDFLLGTCV
jgi:hypothetical protein